ncbi:MAG: methionine--tRNA ligase [Pseudomonadota bacterium]
MRRFYITTPIYYVNARPHLGHAYSSLACDVLARFKRLDGDQVHFLTGTDEHGLKVQKAAEREGMDPKAFTDKVSQNFIALAGLMNYSNDDFIRTTDPRHVKAVQALWLRLKQAGQIYLGSYAGWYAMRDEAYYGEDELTEKDGVKIAPSGSPCEWVEEPAYFFKLSKWGDRLIQHYQENPDFIQPNARRNEVLSFVSSGLRDLCVSRTAFKWGIKVPDDPDHVIYVWIDALTNYLSALGWPDEQSPLYQKFWPADVHMVGKDILRFHTVYWPAMLLAADLPLPKRVFAHGMLIMGGEKMSKSLGNVIEPADFADKFGLDYLRYFMLRELPFGRDGDFQLEALVNRVNNDLANTLGNLCMRTMSLMVRHCPHIDPAKLTLTPAETELISQARALVHEVREAMDALAYATALEKIMAVASNANVYIDGQQPWVIAKKDPERAQTVLYTLLDVARRVVILLQPFVPESCDKLLDQLGVADDRRDLAAASDLWADPHPVTLDKPTPAFPKLEL